jgi:hypothetical protein
MCGSSLKSGGGTNRKREEAEYWRDASALNDFLEGSEGPMPRWFRKPRNDNKVQQHTLAPFVRRYSASTLPWQIDMLEVWPLVKSAFKNAAVRARMRRPPWAWPLTQNQKTTFLFPGGKVGRLRTPIG